MGDPKFPSKKYDTPSHPWQGDRIKLENDLIKKFGLKNKREVWKSQSLLRNFRQQARLLNARMRMADIQAEKEKEQLLSRLMNLGILTRSADLTDVLALEIETVLNRRLQTQVYLKGLAHSTKQARQFIVHGHISVNSRKVTIPGYLVKDSEEDSIEYNQYSSLTNELHPMRPKPKIEVTLGDSQVSKLITIGKIDSEKSPKNSKSLSGAGEAKATADSPKPEKHGTSDADKQSKEGESENTSKEDSN